MKFFSLLFSILVFCGTLYSQWSADPNENTRVTRAALSPIMVSDSTGGAFIVYENDPGLLRQKYVQRLDRYGYVKFPGDGILVSAADKYQSPGAVVIADGSNGIIIGYDDFYSREDTYLQYSFPYVQRIDSSGTKLWGEMGVQVSADTSSTIRAICPDGTGGVFLLCRKSYLLLQHVSSSGELLFGKEGIKLNEKDIGEQAVINYDGLDGIFCATTVYIDSTKEYKLSLHYITKDGIEIWKNQLNNLVDLKILFSKDVIFLIGFLVEYDIPSRNYFFHLRSRVINWDGDLISPEGGYSIKDSLQSYSRTYEAFSDDVDNLLVIYNINDIYSKKAQVYLQKMTSTGDKQFGNFGVLVFPHDHCQNLDNAAYNPQHGVVAICRDNRFNPDNDLWGKIVYSAQRISLDGKRMWPDSGIVLTTQKAGASGGAVSDQAGGAITCWSEIGSDTRWGIFAQQVNRNGNLGEVLATSVAARPTPLISTQYFLYQSYPNPFNASTIIRYQLDKNSHIHLSIFNQLGEQVKNLVDANQSAGQHQIRWDGDDQNNQPLPSGIYFCRINFGNGQTDVLKLLLLK